MRSGFVAIIGRPNVGKSTLLNRFIGEELAIVSSKPQTTRNKIIGIYNGPNSQAVFLDTPGFHETNKALNRAMVEHVEEALKEADVVVLVTEPEDTNNEIDRTLFNKCKGCKVILAINKIDTVMDKPWGMVVERFWKVFNPVACHSRPRSKHSGVIPAFAGNSGNPVNSGDPPATLPSGRRVRGDDNVPVLAISATEGKGCDTLLDKIVEFLPEGEPFYPKDDYTEHPMRFLAAEIVREQAMLLLRQELPYALAVEVEEYKENLSSLPPIKTFGGNPRFRGDQRRSRVDNEIPPSHCRRAGTSTGMTSLTRIKASIIVEKDSQKGIVIGAGGQMVKAIGTAAREKIEKMAGTKVFLDLHVKVVKDWTRNADAVKKYLIAT